VNIAEGAYGRSLYLDSESVQRDGAEVQAWMREVFVDEQRSAHTGVLYYSANTLTRFECTRRTVVPISKVFFGGDGTELRRINLDQVELPVLATPGSLPERLLDEACRSGKKPQPTHVAQADSKSRADVPPGAAAEPAKAAADQGGAKSEKREGQKDEPSSAKPAEAKGVQSKTVPVKTLSTNPVPEAKPATIETKAVPSKTDVAAKRFLDPRITAQAQPAAHEVLRSLAPPARYVERRLAAYPYALRIKPKRAVKVPLVDAHAAKDVKPVDQEVHWSYEGPSGPEHWATLKPEYAACGAGKRQSPIDIQDGAQLDLDPIKFDYRPSTLRIIDNGHTVQINYAEGSSITLSGVRYDLKQLHFHKPSEERVNGKMYDMVAHLLHQSAEGRLAVIAVLLEAGTQNDFIASVWPHLPLEAGREMTLPDVPVDITQLLPEAHAYFTYIGSLTTPPCSEGVLWLVMKSPVSISPAQVAVFGKLYRLNARPVQPANGRLIKESL
jgi:carbonic anhydrase